MPDSIASHTKITPLFALQFCVVLIVIGVVLLRPGVWNGARLAGLCIALPAAVLLFTARWQLGQSFSVTPQAKELVTHGLYAKIRNPIYVFSGLLVLGILISLQYRYALLLLLVLIPIQIVRARQEAGSSKPGSATSTANTGREPGSDRTHHIQHAEGKEPWSKHAEVLISAGHTCLGRLVRDFDVVDLAAQAQGAAEPANSQVQDAASPAQKSAPAADALPPGTVLSVELSKSLDTRKSKANAKIEARTATDLLVHGQIVVPRNTKILGHVTEAKAHSKASPGSLLGITFERMLMKGGREVPLLAIVQAIARPLQLNNLGNEPDALTDRPQGYRARGLSRLAIPPPLPSRLNIRPPPFPNRRASMCPTLPPSVRSLPPVAE